ncbi:helix-turn-helix transcriptional regulator [Ekhidna sp.]|uniref:response regulator transcription factor n=1 Tax=Ekhidna sp. TaxID=2608089 RepID=UPI0032F09D31
MTIHNGDHLTIEYEKEAHRYVMFWHKPPSTFKEFQKEMLTYTKYFVKNGINQALWLHKNYNLPLTEEQLDWVQENVNEPCSETAVKVAFVVGEDAIVHLMVMDHFDDNPIDSEVRHFSSEERARKWLNYDQQEFTTSGKTKITFEGEDENGHSVFTVKTPSASVISALKSFKYLSEEGEFVKHHMKQYLLLTPREKQVLIMMAKGMTSKEIASVLFLSVHTVATHRKAINQKLEITSVMEAKQYVDAFQLYFE